jgi:hypothetical protein
MKHDITFNTRDELLTWLDENFPDAKGLHSNAEGYTVCETDDCMLESKGTHLTIVFKTI